MTVPTWIVALSAVGALVTSAAATAVVAPSAVRLAVAEPLTNATSVDVQWLIPVEAPIVDFFRPPAHAYGPGNRGLEFGVNADTAVRAVDDGVVAFAGQVGGAIHIVVDHDNGIRSGYSHLASADVGEGQRVGRGQQLGRSTGEFHLSARLQPTQSSVTTRGRELVPWGQRRYIDPLPLLGFEVHVRLTPVGGHHRADPS